MTVKEKEKQLNEKLSSAEQSGTTLAKYLYLTDKGFKNTIKPHVLGNWIAKGKLGSLLLTIDKEAFKELTKDFV
jgi:hypothetical protein